MKDTTGRPQPRQSAIEDWMIGLLEDDRVSVNGHDAAQWAGMRWLYEAAFIRSN